MASSSLKHVGSVDPRLIAAQVWGPLLDNLSKTRDADSMKIYPVGEFKAHFSEIMEQVRAGEKIIISYGKKKENIAVVIPYAAYKSKRIQLGLLQDKTLKIHDDFEMSEDELLNL